jgi:integrase/recombinase XerC
MKSFFKEQVLLYLNFLQDVRKYSPRTISTYKPNLFEALNHVSFEFEDDVYMIDLLPYRAYLIGKNKKTIYKKISIFRSFVSYLKDNQYTIYLKNDDNIKISKTLPKPISTRYIFEAIDTCDSDDRILVLLLYTLGLRVSELSNLKLEDIKNSWVRIKGKADKIREIPLLDEVAMELDNYLLLHQPKQYLFEDKGVRINQNRLRYKLSKIFKKIGIKASPHQLRHSFATDLLNGGARIGDVSELLGHASLETTQIYTKLSSSLKMSNYKNAHPMCKE